MGTVNIQWKSLNWKIHNPILIFCHLSPSKAVPCVTHLHQELQHTRYGRASSCVHQFLFYELVIQPIFIELKWETTICWSEKCSAELSIVMGSSPCYRRGNPGKSRAAFPAASTSTQHLHAKPEHSGTPDSKCLIQETFKPLIHNPPNFF